MIENNLTELAHRNADAHAAFEKVRQRWEDRRRELELEVRQRLEEELGGEFRAAQDERTRADAAYRKERERVDVEATTSTLPYPEGTVLVEWMPEHYAWDRRSFRRTGKKGVMQVYRSTDPHPYGQRYSRLTPGVAAVRYLTKDGKPGKKAVSFVPGCWLKEGVVHEKCKLAPCLACGKDRPADGDKGNLFEVGSACPHCGRVKPSFKED